VIRVERSWTQTKQQLRFIERIADLLDDEHRLVQDELLAVLAMKLSLAQTEINKIVKKTEREQLYLSFVKVWRGKYVMQRVALNTVVSDLEEWQRRFDPSWFLIMLIANPAIDQQLAAQRSKNEQEQSGDLSQGEGSKSTATSTPSTRDEEQSHLALATNVREALRPAPRQHISIFLPMLEMQRIDIPFSNAQAAQRGGQWFIIERYTCQAGRSLSAQNNDVRRLARKLASVDPWIFGLLNCKGVIKVVDEQRGQIGSFDFVFRVPKLKDTLQSLRQNLLSGELHYSLTRRIFMAKELAKSVGYVHNLNFVHKHICPETILLFQDLESRFSTFLVGFDNFRETDGGTNLTGDATWERNLYRHPSRQGEFPEEEFKMQHDVYSLGVCLLEIGLWESFVSYSSDLEPKPQYGEAYLQFTKWLEGAGEVESPELVSSPRYQNILAPMLKGYFVHLAKTKLPIVMGDKYSEVVVTCLTCLDKDNEDFGDEDELVDERGVLVAVRFMETILQKLNEISV
jgi:hypothetical protein